MSRYRSTAIYKQRTDVTCSGGVTTRSPGLCAGCVPGGHSSQMARYCRTQHLSATALPFCLPPVPPSVVLYLKNPSYVFIARHTFCLQTLRCCLPLGLGLTGGRSVPPHPRLPARGHPRVGGPATHRHRRCPLRPSSA